MRPAHTHAGLPVFPSCCGRCGLHHATNWHHRRHYTCTWAGATAPGVTRTLSVVVYSNSEGQTAVNASTTSSTIDPTPANNSGSVSVQIGFVVNGIPTLSALGLMLMGLLVGLMGIAAMRRQA